MLGKFVGIICVVLGTIIALWILYNYLVEMQPEAEGLNPLPAIIFVASLYYVGYTKLRKDPEDDE